MDFIELKVSNAREEKYTLLFITYYAPQIIQKMTILHLPFSLLQTLKIALF